MSLDDFVTEEEKQRLAKIEEFARESAKYHSNSKARYSSEQKAFDWINKLPVGIIKQRYVAEYYRIRTKFENEYKGETK